MARPPIPAPDNLPEFSSPEAREIALRPHNINVEITEFDNRRIKELAAFEGHKNKSEVVRRAIEAALGAHPEADHISALAVEYIEHIAKIEKMRAQLGDG